MGWGGIGHRGTLTSCARDSHSWSLHVALAVAGLGLRYFVMPMAVKLGHSLRYPQQMAFKSIEILGLHKDWCANPMLLALFFTVCVKNAIFWGLYAWVLAQSGVANRLMTVWL
jgi:hypothetical protein